MRIIKRIALLAIVGSLFNCGPKIDPGASKTGSNNDAGGNVTCYADVKAIFDQNCVRCHASSKSGSSRKGAPIGVDYDTYAFVKKNIAAGNRTIQSGRMPPDNPLTSDEKSLVQQWVDLDAPECDANGSNQDDKGSTDAGGRADSSDNDAGNGAMIDASQQNTSDASQQNISDASEQNGQTVSYCNDIKPFLETNCTSCHSASNASGGVKLDTFADVENHSSASNAAIQSGSMPKGKTLSTADKSLFNTWVDRGMVECNASQTDASASEKDATAQVEDSGPTPEPVATCSSNKHWTGEESAQMNPGMNCISCHKSGDEAPRYTVAGTVMGEMHDDNKCIGKNGVTVRITDSDNNVTDLQTNSSGNFYTNDSVAKPYTAKVISGTKNNEMFSSQTNTNCMDCHTTFGDNGAPGRIIAP
jgi:hypothetical protein